MPTSNDLMGFGIGPFLGAALGNDPQALTATGTSQTTAAAIRTTNVELTTASSNTGAILPSTAPVGTPFYVAQVSSISNAGIVYAPVGHTMNTTTNGKFTFATAIGMAIFIQTSPKKWWVSPSAATGAVT